MIRIYLYFCLISSYLNCQSFVSEIRALKHHSILSQLKSLNFPQSDCLQIIIDQDGTMESIVDDSIPYMVRDLENIVSQNIYDYEIRDVNCFSQQRSLVNYYKCSLVLVYPQTESSLNKLFVRSSRTMFYPRTKVVVIGLGVPRWNRTTAKFIRENALYLLFVDNVSNQLYSVTGQGIVLEDSFVVDRSDPSVDKGLQDGEKDELRVSSFEYVPYVFYQTETSMDGVDIRIVSELFKYWSIRFVSNRSSPHTWNRQALHEIRDGKSDLALCSSWQSLDNYQSYGLSTFMDAQCGTLLVRSPTLISSALYIYYALRMDVWMIIMLSLSFTAVLLTAFSRFRGTRLRERKKITNYLIYEDFVRSVLDLMAMMSSQSVLKFPSYATARMILLSWTLLSLLLGVVYSSGYTSLLSSPIYTKPTDTIDEFIKKDLLWSSGSSIYYVDLKQSDSRNYQELFRRIHLTSDEIVQAQLMHKDPRYAIFVDVLFKSYVTNTRQLFLRFNRTELPFRCMRSCLYNNFGTLAMRRHSPYMEVINNIIYRLREGGLIEQFYQQQQIADKDRMARLLRTTPLTHDSHSSQSSQVHSFMGAFMFLVIGLSVSGLVFALELLHKRCKLQGP